MPRICINCGSKLVEGSPCDCMERELTLEAIQDQMIAELVTEKTETVAEKIESAVGKTEATMENSETNSKKVQINIDQEMVDKYIDETKKYLGTGIASFVEFIKKPLSMAMHTELRGPICLFFIVLQALSLMLFEMMIVNNVQRIFEELMGSLAYWVNLSDHVNYLSMCLESALIIVISMTTLTLLMLISCQKIGKVEITVKRVISIAVVSTIPMTLGYLGGTIMLFIVPVVSLLCIVLGVIASIILGSHTLLSMMNMDKDKAIYVVYGLYVLQTIVVTTIIQVAIGM